MTHCLSWGINHKLYRKDLAYLKLLAYEKSFYFCNVALDGIFIDMRVRAF